MPNAYVLLNTEIGAENLVLKALKEMDGVQEAYKLWGIYDIIANVEANTMEELKQIITTQIEKIDQIHSKLTMITSDKAPIVFSIEKADNKHPIVEFEPVPVLA
jgi:DNA-binding Lrp family transcriptional regulator